MAFDEAGQQVFAGSVDDLVGGARGQVARDGGDAAGGAATPGNATPGDADTDLLQRRYAAFSLEEKLQDEIEFWRWFITEREKKGTQPVPRKARDALAYAEQKLTAHRNEILSKKI